MKQSFADYLVSSTGQVLETMFFTGIEEESLTQMCEGGGKCCEIAGTVEFQGPLDGELCVGIPRDAAAALASSFLGLEAEDVTAADCEQIAAELANMICGSVLSRCAPQSSFHLEVTQNSSCRKNCDLSVGLRLPEGGMNICARVDRL